MGLVKFLLDRFHILLSLTINSMLSPQIANLVAYYFNVLVAYGIGAQSSTWSEMFHLKSNKQISEKYPTLVTPSGYAFAIWGLIFGLEAISVCWQFTLTEQGEEEKYIHTHGRIPFLFSKGSYYWVVSCLLQCTWTLAFGWDQIFISTGLMLSLLYTTYHTYHENLAALHELTATDMTSEGYAFFWAVVPFAIHASWLVVASIVQVNIFVVARKASSNVQVVVALFSLGVLLLLGCVTAGSLLGSIGYAKTMTALNGTHIGSRIIFLAVLLWAARAIEQFDILLVGKSKKSDDKRVPELEERKGEVTPPAPSRLQTIILQRFRGVVFRCLLGAFLGNIVLFAVKYYQMNVEPAEN